MFNTQQLPFISSVAHHNPHKNAFVVYLLVQEFSDDKIHFLKFLSMRPAKNFYCCSCSCGTSFFESFHRYKEGEVPTSKGKIPCAKNKYEASTTYQAH